jgi:hypothetical protein
MMLLRSVRVAVSRTLLAATNSVIVVILALFSLP